MRGYNTFLENVYSEEIYSVTESDYDEVMQVSLDEDWQGYDEWSAQFDQPADSENFIVLNGKVYHKPQPLSLGRIGGIEL